MSFNMLHTSENRKGDTVCHVSRWQEWQEWAQGKVISYFHLLPVTCWALHCRMWIWTLFSWLIPQDPQPFQAPHRKPHTLCITNQAYFGAEKQKIERNTELSGLPQTVPQLLNISVGKKKRGLVPTIRNYQEENMKYLALSSPSSLLYFLAQTSWGGKK